MKNLNILKLLVFVFLISTTICFAQEEDNKNEDKILISPIKIGFKGGFSLGKLSNSDDNIYTRNYESVSGFDWGLIFEMPFTKTFSLQPEINFTHRGGVRDGFQPITSSELSEQLNQFLPFLGLPLVTDENPLYADFESESNLKYLEIPVLAKLGWGNDIRFFVQGGPYLGILLSAKQETVGTSQFYFDADATNPVVVPNSTGGTPPLVQLPAQSLTADTDVKDDLHIVNFGAIAGVGVSKKMNEKGELFFDARASYSFNAIQINDQYGESRVGGVIFSFGYSHSL
ncbi:MAG: porin family protein [Urechidicola sp.]|nr:porin family protein [Urechidicola sp.]